MNPLSPDLTGVTCRWVASGHDYFVRLIRALDEARRSIRLEVYIFTRDPVGLAVRDALLRAARRGVEVRVLLDALGSGQTDAGFWAELIHAGGQVRWFNPLHPVRSHRKLLVVDDRVAGTGGFNIAEEYTGDGVQKGWADLGIVLVGAEVMVLSDEFDRMWSVAAHGGRWKRLLSRRGGDVPKQVSPGISLLATRPGRMAGVFQIALKEDLRQARDILLVVAYFLPTRGIRKLLKSSALRGKRVRLVVPGHSDVVISRRAARHLYGPLMRCGVEIYEYQPQMLHAKLYLTDHSVFAGSSNLDVRSLYINHEIMLRVTDPQVVQEGWSLGESLCARSLRVDPKTWNTSRSWLERQGDRWSWWLLSKFDPWATRWIARDPR